MHTQMIDSQHSGDSKRLIEEYLLDDANLGFLDSSAPKHFGRTHQIPKTAKLQTVSIIDTLSELARDGELKNTEYNSSFSSLNQQQQQHNHHHHLPGVARKQKQRQNQSQSEQQSKYVHNVNVVNRTNSHSLLDIVDSKRYGEQNRVNSRSTSGGALGWNDGRMDLPTQSNELFNWGVNYDAGINKLGGGGHRTQRFHQAFQQHPPLPPSSTRQNHVAGGGAAAASAAIAYEKNSTSFLESQSKVKSSRNSRNNNSSELLRVNAVKNTTHSKNLISSTSSSKAVVHHSSKSRRTFTTTTSRCEKEMSRSCFSDSEIDSLDCVVSACESVGGIRAKSKCPSNECLDSRVVAFASTATNKKLHHLTPTNHQTSSSSHLQETLKQAVIPKPKVQEFPPRKPRKHHVPEWIRTLFVTAKQGNVEMLKLSMVDMDSALVRNLSDPSGNNLWHLCAAHKQLACLQWLCYKFGDDGLRDENKSGQMPVILAVKFGSLSVVQWLFEHYPNYNATVRIDNNRSLLHFAAKYGQGPVLSWMLKTRTDESDINVVDSGGNTPLHLSAKYGHIECLKEMVLHRGDLTLRNDAGLKPYDVALCGNKKSCAEYLLSLEACLSLSKEQCQLVSDMNRYKLRNTESKKTIKDLMVLLNDSLKHQRDLVDSFKRIEREFHQKEEEADDHSAESEKGEERRNDNIHLEFHNTLNAELERFSSCVLPNDETACQNIEERWKRASRKTNKQMTAGKPDPMDIFKSQFAQIQRKVSYYAALQNIEEASLSESSLLDESSDDLYDFFKKQNLHTTSSRPRSSWLASLEPESSISVNSNRSSISLSTTATAAAATIAGSCEQLSTDVSSSFLNFEKSARAIEPLKLNKKASPSSSSNSNPHHHHHNHKNVVVESGPWSLGGLPHSDVDLRELFERNPELKQEGRTCSVLEVLEPSSSENEELVHLNKNPNSSKKNLDVVSLISNSSWNTKQDSSSALLPTTSETNLKSSLSKIKDINSQNKNPSHPQEGQGGMSLSVKGTVESNFVGNASAPQIAATKRFSVSRSISALQSSVKNTQFETTTSSSSSPKYKKSSSSVAMETKRKISSTSAPILEFQKPLISSKDETSFEEIETDSNPNSLSNCLGLTTTSENEDKTNSESVNTLEAGAGLNQNGGGGGAVGLKKKGFLLKFSLKNRWSSKQKQRSPKKSLETVVVPANNNNSSSAVTNAAATEELISLPTPPPVKELIKSATSNSFDNLSTESLSSSHNYEFPLSDTDEIEFSEENPTTTPSSSSPIKKMERPFERLLPPPPPSSTRREPPPTPSSSLTNLLEDNEKEDNSSSSANNNLPDILSASNLTSVESSLNEEQEDGTGESLSNNEHFFSNSDLSRLYGSLGKSDSRPPSSASRIESTMRMDNDTYKSVNYPLSKMSSASTELLLMTPDSSTAGRQSPAPSEVSKTESALSPPSDVSKTESQRHMNHLGRIEESLNVAKNQQENNNGGGGGGGGGQSGGGTSKMILGILQSGETMVAVAHNQENVGERMEFENLPESLSQQFRQPANISKKRSINRPWYEVSDDEDILTPGRFKPLGNQSNSEDESQVLLS